MVDLTPDILALRLKRAREAAGLTQEAAAKALELSRPVLAHIEGGKRGVSSLEATAMARLYGVSLLDLLAEEAPPPEALLTARLRTPTGEEQDGSIVALLNQMLAVCRETIRLERRLGHHKAAPSAPRFELDPPASLDEAAEQGRELAKQERARLSLGHQPVPYLPDLLSSQGVRVWTAALPPNTSGLFFTHADTGHIIVISEAEGPERRLFSHAHEYCHALVDRDRLVVISRGDERDPVERRADVFAINFLAPPEAIREFLSSQVLYAEGRASPVMVMLCARHFSTSYEAMVFQFLDMSLITRSDLDSYRSPGVKREARARVDALSPVKHEAAVENLAQWVLSVGSASVSKGMITKAKFLQLAERVGASRQRAETLLRPRAALDASFY